MLLLVYCFVNQIVSIQLAIVKLEKSLIVIALLHFAFAVKYCMVYYFCCLNILTHLCIYVFNLRNSAVKSLILLGFFMLVLFFYFFCYLVAMLILIMITWILFLVEYIYLLLLCFNLKALLIGLLLVY